MESSPDPRVTFESPEPAHHYDRDTDSPAPSPPQGRRSVERAETNDREESPRLWLKSPGSAALPTALKVALVLEGNDAGPQSPLVATRELDDHSFEVKPHRGTGELASTVDFLFRCADLNEPDAFEEVLNVLPYNLSEDAAEGFHTALLAVSPDSMDNALGMLVDGDNGELRALTLTMGSVLEQFQRDHVTIDACAVAVSASTGDAVDLLAGPAPSFNVGYRQKWGLCGLTARFVNDFDDVARLPTHGEVTAATGLLDMPVVMYQFRLRRTQSVQLQHVGGDFDVIQHISFVALPPEIWALGSPVATPAVARPIEAADAVVASLTAHAPPGMKAGADAEPGTDDSMRFQAFQLLQSVLREVFSGNTCATAILATGAEQLASGPAAAAALHELSALRISTARVAHPVSALEIVALRQADSERAKAIEATKALVRFIEAPAVLVDRDTWNIEATNAAADAFLPDEILVLELCASSSSAATDRDDSGADVLTAAEIADIEDLTETAVFSRVAADTEGAQGAAARRVAAVDIVGPHLLLVRFAGIDTSKARGPTSASDADATSARAPSTDGSSSTPAADPATNRVAKHHQATRQIAEERRRASSKANTESSCSCVIA